MNAYKHGTKVYACVSLELCMWLFLAISFYSAMLYLPYYPPIISDLMCCHSFNYQYI